MAGRILEVTVADGGLGGMSLTETVVTDPYVKDYDAIEGAGPAHWRALTSRTGGLSAASPGERNAGTGSALFQAAADWARALGCGWLKIETQNVNAAACRFYQKMGCTQGTWGSTEPAAASRRTASARLGGHMPGPFIFIATNRLRDGRFDAEQRRVPGLSRFIDANEPRLIAFNEYVNEERSEVTVVQVHPDAASMKFHMGIVADRARQAYAQTLEATR